MALGVALGGHFLFALDFKKRRSMRYSFDDLAIGVIRDDQKVLVTRDIQRPKGLTLHAWYAHAGQICTLLNQVAKAAPDTSSKTE